MAHNIFQFPLNRILSTNNIGYYAGKPYNSSSCFREFRLINSASTIIQNDFWTPVVANSIVFVYNGSSWVAGSLKKYNGTSWVDASALKYNGSSWV